MYLNKKWGSILDYCYLYYTADKIIFKFGYAMFICFICWFYICFPKNRLLTIDSTHLQPKSLPLVTSCWILSLSTNRNIVLGLLCFFLIKVTYTKPF